MPTNALYWTNGKVAVMDDLCVHCGACVLNCMVDDCIKIERKREDGTKECFSKPKDVIALTDKLNSKRRLGRVKTIFPSAEDYRHRYRDKPDL